MPTICPICGITVADDIADRHVNECLDKGGVSASPPASIAPMPPPPPPGTGIADSYVTPPLPPLRQYINNQPPINNAHMQYPSPPPAPAIVRPPTLPPDPVSGVSTTGSDGFVNVVQCLFCDQWVTELEKHIASEHPTVVDSTAGSRGNNIHNDNNNAIFTEQVYPPAPNVTQGFSQGPPLPAISPGRSSSTPPPPAAREIAVGRQLADQDEEVGMGEREVSNVECPVCCSKVPRPEALAHINSCLDGSSTNEPSHPGHPLPPSDAGGPPMMVLGNGQQLEDQPAISRPPPSYTPPPPVIDSQDDDLNNGLGDRQDSVSSQSLYRSVVSRRNRLPPLNFGGGGRGGTHSAGGLTHNMAQPNNNGGTAAASSSIPWGAPSSGRFNPEDWMTPRREVETVQICPQCGLSAEEVVGNGSGGAEAAFLSHVQKCMDEAEQQERRNNQVATTSTCPYCGKQGIPQADFIQHASQCLAESEAQIFCAVCQQWKKPHEIFTFDCKWNHKFCFSPCAQNLVTRVVEQQKTLLECPLCRDTIASTDIVCFYGGEKQMKESKKYGKFLTSYKAMELAKSLENFARCPTPGCKGIVELPQSNPNHNDTMPSTLASPSEDTTQEWVHAHCPSCTLPFCYIKNGRNVTTIQTAVMDLYLSLTRAAVHSGRWKMIFSPFPKVSDSRSAMRLDPPAEDADDAMCTRAITLAQEVVDQIPAMKALVSEDTTRVVDVRRNIDSLHPLSYSLFQWILTSHRAELTLIPASHRIQCMGTPYQFLMKTGPPEAEQQFQQLKKKHGAKFAFHGSRAENWHSILHNGLRNASGTKLQVNGARYGAGVYLSPKASVSFGYSQISTSSSSGSGGGAGEGFFDHKSMHCIAVTECCDHKIKKSNGGDIWVQPNEACVQTRFLFVYQHGESAGGDTDLGKDAVVKQFKRAMDVVKLEGRVSSY